MNSRHSNSLAASRRSQSTIWRCTSGSDTRRRSGRGGKSPPRASRAGSFRPTLPLAPDQKAVGQHHTHGMPMESLPSPTLILVPTQEPLGLLVKPLHPMPPVRRIPPGGPASHPPPSYSSNTSASPRSFARRSASPGAGGPRNESARRAPRRTGPQPALAPVTPRHRAPRPCRQSPDQVIGPLDQPAVPAQAHGEVATDGRHVALPSLLQAIQEVRIIAVIGVGDHTGPAHAPGSGLANRSKAIWGLVWKVMSWGT